MSDLWKENYAFWQVPVYLPQPPCSLAVARTMTFWWTGWFRNFANPCCDKFGRYFNYHFRWFRSRHVSRTYLGRRKSLFVPRVSSSNHHLRQYPEEYLFLSMFNTVGGSTEYSSGGIALSNWNIRSNQSGNTGDWWYSYLNQCSVYNTAVEAEGQNKEAAQRFQFRCRLRICGCLQSGMDG